jgi:hypothetical protein
MLARIAAGLAVAHVIVMFLYYRESIGVDDWVHGAFFDLDEEESFGTWFSAVILLYAGRLLLGRARSAKGEGDPYHPMWFVLAIGFHLLSIDEVVGMHEYVNTVSEDIRWTTFAAVIVALLGLAYLPFLSALPSRIRLLFIVAAVVYVGGAVGVERATDWYDAHDLLDTLAYNLWTAVEETMEMTGAIVFIYALLLVETERKNRA